MSKKGKSGASKPTLTLEQLKTKAKPALAYRDQSGSPVLVEIANSAASGNKAYEEAFLETGRVKLAVACRDLTAIKLRFGKQALKAFTKSVSSASPSQNKKVKLDQQKGVSQMETITKPEVQEQEDASRETIPLKGIEFRAAVNGAFARVRLIQTFKNLAQKPVEAVYVFPLPDEAVVTACAMKIGRKKIKAELKRREQARQDYEQAVSAGHHAALVEQERPNIFTMNVGGIEPGETIEVELEYLQRIPWQAGEARFRIPLVVAPRFIAGRPVGQKSGGWSPDTDAVPDASRITPKVSPQGVPYAAQINVSFAPGYRCKFSSPSHPLLISEQEVGKDDAEELATGEIRTDRDFTLAYRARRKTPSVALHRQTVAGETFVLASVIPSGEVAAQAADIAVLLDVSGSMQGSKLAGLKRIAKGVITQLIEQKFGHRAALIAFSNYARPLCGLTEVNEQMFGLIDGLEAGGGTALGEALTEGHKLLGQSERPKVILLVSDGQADSQHYVGSGARIICAGIDAAVNDTVLKDLARETGGSYIWFNPGEDFTRATNSLAGMLSGPVLRELKVEGGSDVRGLQDAFADRPAVIAMRFAKGVSVPRQIKLTGLDPAGQAQFVALDIQSAAGCDFADKVWARERIRESRDSEEQVKASLQYGVICGQTAFVAISQKEVPGSKPERIEIPVELPSGWEMEEHWAGGVTKAAMCCLSSVDSMDADFGDGGRLYGSAGGDELLGSPGVKRFAGRSRQGRLVAPPQRPGKGPTVVCGRGGFGQVPPAPPGQISGRFALDAADAADRLIGIWIAASAGQADSAQEAFDRLNLTVKAVKALTEEKRAMVLYFAAKLTLFGLKLEAKALAALNVKPASAPALAWWQQAARAMGIKVFDLVPILAAWDGGQYLLWKTGQGTKPTIEPWSLVP